MAEEQGTMRREEEEEERRRNKAPGGERGSGMDLEVWLVGSYCLRRRSKAPGGGEGLRAGCRGLAGG